MTEKVYSLKKNSQCKIKVGILGMICENRNPMKGSHVFTMKIIFGLVGSPMRFRYKTRKVSHNI